MFKAAVAKTMSCNVWRYAPNLQWCWAPELSTFFITYIESFTTQITNRVIVPRCQTEFMGIVYPCIGLSTFGNDAAKIWVGQYIAPWGWGFLIRLCNDHIFLSII